MFWDMLVSMEMLVGITERFKQLRGLLDERSRRLLVAAESKAIGPRGISAVSRATGGLAAGDPAGHGGVERIGSLAREADSTFRGWQEESGGVGLFVEKRP